MGRANLRVVFVVDGLRPDLIDWEHTPTIARLRDGGVSCSHAHAAVPSVTRINAAVLVTGCDPGSNGVVGNQMYRADVRADGPFSTADGASVQRLGEVSGRVLTCPTLAELLTAEDLTFVSVGSGSSGSALLLNTGASGGDGIMINTNQPRHGVPLAIPGAVQNELLERFGPPPPKSRDAGFTETVAYATSVICGYVLPELRPDLLLVWLTEPDHSQHVFGLGSAQAVAARRIADDAIDEVLGSIDDHVSLAETDVMIVSDHGFSAVRGTIDVTEELVRAGLKGSVASTDVVVADTGCAALHVEGRDPRRIASLVQYLQRSDWAEAIFTAPQRPGQAETVDGSPDGAHPDAGWVEGSFSTGWLGYTGHEREADIVVSLPWSDRPDTHGIRGDTLVLARAGQIVNAAHHGNLSPHDVRSTLIGWGPSFRSGVRSEVPAGNLDVAPTLLHLFGLDGGGLDGRILLEFLIGEPPKEPAIDRWAARTGPNELNYAATLQVASVDGHRYLSWAARDRSQPR